MRNLLLAAIIGLALPGSLVAQAEENDNIPAKLREQQENYERGIGLYPAKPRSRMSIVGQAGYGGVYGDVRQQMGYTGALGLEKSLGHLVSLRAMGAYTYAKGMNTSLSRGYALHGFPNPTDEQLKAGLYPDPFMNGQVGGSYYDKNTGVAKGVYYNYASYIADFGLQAMLHLGNINYYKENNKWDFYLGAGPGLMAVNTMVDAKKKTVGGPYTLYDFEAIDKAAQKEFKDNADKYDGILGQWRKDRYTAGLIKDELKSEDKGRQFNYETNSGTDAQMRFFLNKGMKSTTDMKNKNIWGLFPTLTGSIGARYKVNDRIEVGLEQRMIYSQSDLLDGKRWQERGSNRSSVLTSNKDLVGNTTVTLGYRFGKNATDALWWVNPNNMSARSVADNRKTMKSLEEDGDADGVADLFDKDPNTPEGNIVDGAGRTLDLDQDGVADNVDAQPYTPRGCAVDAKGVAKDSDNDGVADCLDKESNTKAGALVDANGREIVMPKWECSNCAEYFKTLIPAAPVTPVTPVTPTPAVVACNLPSIHFDAGSAVVKQQFYPELYQVAKYMMDNPGSVRVVGSDDKSEKVARKRAEAAVNFIVGNFGVDRGRFIIEAGTGMKVANSSSKNAKFGPLDYLNRRVDFECR